MLEWIAQGGRRVEDEVRAIIKDFVGHCQELGFYSKQDGTPWEGMEQRKTLPTF